MSSDPPSLAPSGAVDAPSPAPSDAPSAKDSDDNATGSSNPPSSSSSSSIPSSSPTVASTLISTTPPPTYAALPIQPINILVLTDIHSWVMGHGDHEEDGSDADFGDVLGLYQRLKALCDDDTNLRPDLYLVMNGDFVHGTYLGADPPRYLPGILERMPFDVVSLGDHEVRNAASLAMLREPGGVFDAWGDALVTSNVRVADATNTIVDFTDPGDLVPLGSNYRLLRGNHGTVLVLGFLYEMDAHETGTVTVERVEDVMMERPWFTSPFEFDAVLVMAHIDARDGLIAMMHAALREFVGAAMPIQFVAGHTHVRAYDRLDGRASSFEAGGRLDTVGFVSFDPGAAESTEHVFVEANRESLAQALGQSQPANDDAGDEDEDFYPSTKDGAELSRFIRRTMNHSGANEVVGCSNSRYRAGEYANGTDSLMGLYRDHVLPASPYHRSPCCSNRRRATNA